MKVFLANWREVVPMRLLPFGSSHGLCRAGCRVPLVGLVGDDGAVVRGGYLTESVLVGRRVCTVVFGGGL